MLWPPCLRFRCCFYGGSGSAAFLRWPLGPLPCQAFLNWPFNRGHCFRCRLCGGSSTLAASGGAGVFVVPPVTATVSVLPLAACSAASSEGSLLPVPSNQNRRWQLLLSPYNL